MHTLNQFFKEISELLLIMRDDTLELRYDQYYDLNKL